jgi:hypothetical protein
MLDQNIPYRPASVNPNDKQQQKELARAWQRQKENWRRTVAVRFRTWLHVAVAGELDACFNSKTGEAAFAGTRKMAKNLHIDRRNVRNAIDDLVTAEPPMLCRHLKREPGRRSKTIYLMMGALDWSKKGEDGIGGSPAPYEKTDRGFTSPPMGGSPAPYIGVHRPP